MTANFTPSLTACFSSAQNQKIMNKDRETMEAEKVVNWNRDNRIGTRADWSQSNIKTLEVKTVQAAKLNDDLEAVVLCEIVGLKDCYPVIPVDQLKPIRGGEE